MEADRVEHLAGNRSPEAILANCRRIPTTGSAGISEFTEIDDGTQEIRMFPLMEWGIRSTSAKHKATEMNTRKSESAIVVMKRVMTVERRAGR